MIDLDAARAARREAKGDGPVIRFNEKDFNLPAEVSFGVVDAAAKLSESADPSAVLVVVRAIMGDAYESFMAENPSVDDLEVLIGGALDAYGLGEQPASSES